MSNVSVKKMMPASRRGFTLIEMTVAGAIFAILMVASVGAMLTIIDTNAKAQALQTVINNLNFAVESMAKNMRIGTNYHCDNYGPIGVPQDCPDGAQFFAFEPVGGNPASDADQVIYQYDSVNKQILRSTDGGADFLPLTAPEVVIDSLTFYTVGTGTSDQLQPKVIISIHAHAGSKTKVQSDFTIQTSVSQRLLDS